MSAYVGNAYMTYRAAARGGPYSKGKGSGALHMDQALEGQTLCVSRLLRSAKKGSLQDQELNEVL